VQGALVKKDPVAVLAVLAERLAVIGDDHDKGVVSEVTLVQHAQETRELRIDEGDRAKVRDFLVHRAIRFGQRVRRVRVVEMHPRKEWRGVPPRHPLNRFVNHDVRRPPQLRVSILALPI
jgi:hypothetical protein